MIIIADEWYSVADKHRGRFGIHPRMLTHYRAKGVRLEVILPVSHVM